ncbi:flagellar hook-length control protein FliK [Magnetococcales bacterium HHB-1]
MSLNTLLAMNPAATLAAKDHSTSSPSLSSSADTTAFKSFFDQALDTKQQPQENSAVSIAENVAQKKAPQKKESESCQNCTPEGKESNEENQHIEEKRAPPEQKSQAAYHQLIQMENRPQIKDGKAFTSPQESLSTLAATLARNNSKAEGVIQPSPTSPEEGGDPFAIYNMNMAGEEGDEAFIDPFSPDRYRGPPRPGAGAPLAEIATQGGQTGSSQGGLFHEGGGEQMESAKGFNTILKGEGINSSQSENFSTILQESSKTETKSATTTRPPLPVYSSRFADDFMGEVGRMRLIARPGMPEQVRMRLDPVDLGEMNLQMHVDKENQVFLSITVENESAKEALNRQIMQLREALALQNLSFGDVSVEVDQRKANEGGEGQENGKSFSSKEEASHEEGEVRLERVFYPRGPTGDHLSIMA